MNFSTVIEKYRKQAFSEADKGKRFERLIKAYFLTAPIYQTEIKTVWLWDEFPYRKDFGSGKDLGIDLVAETTSGDFWAIQCKCYAEDAYIDKPAIDTFLSTSSKRFGNEELIAKTFSLRFFVATSRNFSKAVEETIIGQNIPVKLIGLETLENAPVDWEALENGVHGSLAVDNTRSLMEHQQKAIDKFHEHFQTYDRGRLIMACGTGKTFTSLRLAENEYPNGLILFLVPSIALLGQSLAEWATFAKDPLKAICICSDAEVSKHKKDKDDVNSPLVDLAFPASTNVPQIVQQFQIKRAEKGGMTVVFSTYQSIERIAEAQKVINANFGNSCVFDLIICDEAHRTTGYSLKDNESAFQRVHDNDFIQGKKRLYMTATPRLYKLADEIKNQIEEKDALLCSMDDEALYGKEVFRIGFGEAVEKNLLSDYKVLILTVKGSEIPAIFKQTIANSNGEIETDDISKLIGCINALSKRTIADEDLVKAVDPGVMHTAIAYCQNINYAKHYTEIFNQQKELYYESLTAEERESVVYINSDHVNGSMGALDRQNKLSWLKNTPTGGNECRLLTNVRCLSEGVDVPSLDAVIFLSAKNSEIDVVQSVGRVMRKPRNGNKKYGYIIIPVVIPEGESPEDALDNSDCYKVVWHICKALRAHDDRFDSEIAKLDLNKRKGGRFIITDGNTIGKGGGSDDDGNGSGNEKEKQVQPELAFSYDNLPNLIYAQLVKKVGTRKYWELWAKDVAKVAERHINRITELVSTDDEYKKAFNQFLAGLRRILNPSVSDSEAVEMLAQHIITKPVFEALFENYSFVSHNPVSSTMQEMIDLLKDEIPANEAELMARFYKSIRERVEGIDNAEGKQKVIVELYDKFFKSAFPKVVEKLGIVYTPVEVVDFIIHSVADVLQKEFGRTIADENVHILDPFTGTGTFITRLLQSGLIPKEDLKRKYENELHANEIVLLAYYIASINIENAFHDAVGADDYTPFEGICLTDTFQMTEPKNSNDLPGDAFRTNSERVEKQKNAPIRIIIGNPPYSIGQKSANDNSQNQKYPLLDTRVETTYANSSKAGLRKALYDPYIKAFRWATDRLENRSGIICFVSNAGWIDGNALDGFRNSLEKEFSSIYVFNLRGNQRTSGELSRKEGGKIFDSGCRTPISITLLVKQPKGEQNGKAQIFYYEVADYMNRLEKLKLVKDFGSILNSDIGLTQLTPNEHGDWLNQRNDVFSTYIPVEPEKKFDDDSKTFFSTFAIGVATNRDAWAYNFSTENLSENMGRMIAFYNEQVHSYTEQKESNRGLKVDEFIDTDPCKISWTVNLKKDLEKQTIHEFQKQNVVCSMYRPFCQKRLYYNRNFVERPGLSGRFFPKADLPNMGICVSGIGGNKPFSVLMTDNVVDLQMQFNGQYFPRYYYEETENAPLSLFDTAEGEYKRKDAITDFIFQRCRELYGPKTSRDDIFYYVYGLLHSEDYRNAFAADLKKMLPRIPLVNEVPTFRAISKAGRELAELHLNYETQPEPENILVNGENMIGNDYRVSKMVFGKKKDAETGKMVNDPSVIIYNHQITIENIPSRAYDYIVNGKSAIEWVMEWYSISEDKKTGIVNDPNKWAEETNNERYILTLLLSIINVSCKTVDIVSKLPKLTF
jgi:predicted helicase